MLQNVIHFLMDGLVFLFYYIYRSVHIHRKQKVEVNICYQHLQILGTSGICIYCVIL